MFKRKVSVIIRSLKEKQKEYKDRWQNGDPYAEYCKGVYFGLQIAIAMLCKQYDIWED